MVNYLYGDIMDKDKKTKKNSNVKKKNSSKNNSASKKSSNVKKVNSPKKNTVVKKKTTKKSNYVRNNYYMFKMDTVFLNVFSIILLILAFMFFYLIYGKESINY